MSLNCALKQSLKCMIPAVFSATKGLKNLGVNGDLNHDLYDAGTVLYQLSHLYADGQLESQWSLISTGDKRAGEIHACTRDSRTRDARLFSRHMFSESRTCACICLLSHSSPKLETTRNLTVTQLPFKLRTKLPHEYTQTGIDLRRQ